MKKSYVRKDLSYAIPLLAILNLFQVSENSYSDSYFTVNQQLPESLEKKSKNSLATEAHNYDAIDFNAVSAIIDMEERKNIATYFFVMREKDRDLFQLPSGNRCRNCSSEMFYFQDKVEYKNFERPLICEKYECNECGQVTDYWKYEN